MKIPTRPLVPSALLLGVVTGLVACAGPGPETVQDATAAAHGELHATHRASVDPGTPSVSGHEAHAGPSGPASTRAVQGEVSPLGQESVYQLPGIWRDRNGDELELSDLAGRSRVLAFVYTSCTFACPRIVARMKRIEDVAGPDSDVGFVLVSIDPERDTPERLAHFAEGSRLDAERWTLLNGGPDRLLELSVLLGVKYRSAGPGQLAHDNALILLDEEGIPVARVDGLESELDPILERVAAGAADAR